MSDLGQRHYNVLSSLLSKGQQEEAYEHLLELGEEEFDCLNKYAIGVILEDEKGKMVGSLLLRASATRTLRNVQLGEKLLSNYNAFEDEEEQKDYVLSLTEENQQLLKKTFWKHQSGGKAFTHILCESALPTKKRALASLAAGGLGATGAAVSGASVGPALLTGAGVALFTDIIITGFEEDEATKRVGQGLRSLLITKPKNWLMKLVTKEEV